MVIGSAKDKNNARAQKRVKHLYVAMTRPKDFLCLALPQTTYMELCQNPTIKNWLDNSFVADNSLLT